MTTTVSVLPKGQVRLPEEFRRRKKSSRAWALRVTEVGYGLYVTPLPEPTEQELREVIAAAGSLARRQTPEDGKMVQRTIANFAKKNGGNAHERESGNSNREYAKYARERS